MRRNWIAVDLGEGKCFRVDVSVKKCTSSHDLTKLHIIEKKQAYIWA